MWLIISALCIPVTILEMFSRTQFFTKTGGCRIFFSRPVAGLTNRGHVRDFWAGAPLRILFILFLTRKQGVLRKKMLDTMLFFSLKHPRHPPPSCLHQEKRNFLLHPFVPFLAITSSERRLKS